MNAATEFYAAQLKMLIASPLPYLFLILVFFFKRSNGGWEQERMSQKEIPVITVNNSHRGKVTAQGFTVVIKVVQF